MAKRGKIAALSTAAVGLVLLRAAAHAGTFYVAPDGDDAKSGTPESPLRTIQKAAKVVRPRDSLLLRTGVYKGHIMLRSSGCNPAIVSGSSPLSP